MTIMLSEADTRVHARQALASPELQPDDASRLYDPARPLPPLPAPPTRLPSLYEVLRLLPEHYERRMTEAYVQVSDFAVRWWPALGAVALAEPFFEYLMHADLFRPSYRDHIVHQTRVAAIGDRLMQEAGGDHPLAKGCRELDGRLMEIAGGGSAGKLRRVAWWLAGLFHDCGYPYQFHAEQFRTLRDTYRVSIGSPSSAHWLPCLGELASLADGLLPADLIQCAASGHAFTSATELAEEEAHYGRTTGKGEEPEFQSRRRALLALAVRAILRHHTPPGAAGATPRLSCEQEPLAYLLILSDELHESDRVCSRLVPPDKADGDTALRYEDGEITSVALTWEPDQLVLTFGCRRDAGPKIRGRSPQRWAEDKLATLQEALVLPPTTSVALKDGRGVEIERATP